MLALSFRFQRIKSMLITEIIVGEPGLMSNDLFLMSVLLTILLFSLKNLTQVGIEVGQKP